LARKYYFLISISLTLFIGWGSLVSTGSAMPSKIHISDKIIHAVSYFLLTLVWFRCFKEESKKIKISFLIVLLVFIYGIIIEILQGIATKNRQPEIYDAIANLIGIVIAIAVFKKGFQKKLLN
jgi:VanZ family protein